LVYNKTSSSFDFILQLLLIEWCWQFYFVFHETKAIDDANLKEDQSSTKSVAHFPQGCRGKGCVTSYRVPFQETR